MEKLGVVLIGFPVLTLFFTFVLTLVGKVVMSDSSSVTFVGLLPWVTGFLVVMFLVNWFRRAHS